MTPDPHVGRVLAERYRIVRPLGEGGMGAVYEGIQLDLERRVALKLLHPRLAADARLHARFEREARLAARLQHPHLVQVTDFGVHEGEPFMVMEYVDGETLRDFLRRQPEVALERALEIVCPVLRALAVVHEAEVVHRDIKPENVLLIWDDQVVLPKLLDFGVARGDGHERLTRTHGTLGTAAYMAPEQVRAAREAGPAADQFSMGVMLYEMLSGELPHAAPSAAELAAAKLTTEPRSLAEHRDGLPDRVVDATMRALAIDPAARFVDVTALRHALEGSSAGSRSGDCATGTGGPPTLRALDSSFTLDASESQYSALDAPAETPRPGTRERPAPQKSPSRIRSRLGVGLVAAAGLAVGLAFLAWPGASATSVARPVESSVTAEAAPGEEARARLGESADEVAPEHEADTPEEPEIPDPAAAELPTSAERSSAPRRARVRAHPRVGAGAAVAPTAARAVRRRIVVEGYDSWTAQSHLGAGQAALDTCVRAASLPEHEVRVRIRIAADGEFLGAAALDDTPAAFARCSSRALQRVTWSPPIAGAGAITVTYALEP